jgi:hypothetical protein
MTRIDRVVFGDNQFFGINHMSQEKAQQLAEQFRDLGSIFGVYDMAFEAGIRGVMLNSNERAVDICERFRARKSQYPELNWYPSIPYPHKYANLISEMGILPALQNILSKNGSAFRTLSAITQGGIAIVSKDAIQLMRMLVDVEMQMFAGLNIKTVFLQNVVTDTILGLRLKDFFVEYCEHIRKKYRALPGFITQNMPELVRYLRQWGISEVVICTSINKIGYLMSPGIDEYKASLRANDALAYQIMAMSTLASGAVPARQAYEFINELNVQSIVFGASSRKHIIETVDLIGLGSREAT